MYVGDSRLLETTGTNLDLLVVSSRHVENFTEGRTVQGSRNGKACRTKRKVPSKDRRFTGMKR